MTAIDSRWFLFGSMAVVVSLSTILGCNADVSRTPAKAANDPLTEVRAAYERKAYDEAAAAACQLLIQRPNDPDVALLAARIEAARLKPDLAVDLAGSIDVKGPLGLAAAELRYRQSLLARDDRQAELALADLATIEPDNVRWKHERWQLFNLQGRRQEACELADQFCRQGIATDSELLSLIRRSDSFPLLLPGGSTPEDFFYPGLGVARWYFTQKNYLAAIDALESQRDQLTTSPPAIALYGRLLAETQQIEKHPSWFASCNDTVKGFGDCWAGLGQMAISRGENKLAARSLLEAIYINPTDRSSMQRVASALDAVGQSEDADQFRYRAVELATTENAADQLVQRGNSVSLRKSISRQLMELGRPFETLQWTASFLPSKAVRERTVIDQQRDQLLRDDRALNMASLTSLLGLERGTLPAEAELERIVGGSAVGSPLLSQLSGAKQLARPRLVNVAEAVGLDFQWYHDETINLASIPIYQSVGGGIAVIDFDLDGWPDVYLAQGYAKPHRLGTKSNQLFRNLGGRFMDRTSETATTDYCYSSGQAVGDVNQDGFPDIYVGNLGQNRLLINNGDGTFGDRTERIAAHEDTFTTSVAIADINGDALPDIYEGNYVEMERAFERPKVAADGREVQPSPLEHYPKADRLFESLGDGRFAAKFIDNQIAKPSTSLGIVIADFNDDRRNEIFVGNDERPNHYLMHEPNGGLRNSADAMGCANGYNGASTGCMGIATGDFNRDGLLDLHIANFRDESANLYLQDRSGAFVDAAVRYGLDQLTLPYVGFGAKALDLDRNGWLDVLVTNGHIFDMRHLEKPFQMPPQVLMASGNRYEQVEVDDPSGYFSGEYLGRALTMIDFDNDRSVDFLCGHLDAKLALLRNETKTSAHFLQLELVGSDTERDAIGVKIVVQAGGQSFSQWVTAGDGYFSSDQSVVDLGLGQVQSIESLTVLWPAGGQQSFSDLSLDQRYLVVENESQLWAREPGRDFNKPLAE